MSFLIAYIIFSISCIVITSRTLVSYSECAMWLKIAIVALVCVAWLFPLSIWNLRSNPNVSDSFYAMFSKVGYFLYGVAFLLLCFLLLRDIVWSVAYISYSKKIYSPADPHILDIANVITVVFVFLLGIYATYQAQKLPQILKYEYTDTRVLEPVKLVMISDIHINRATEIKKVRELVAYINSLHPDVLLMVGDIGDDDVSNIKPHLKELKKLKAKKGIYYVIGNHEAYNNAPAWEAQFAQIGWIVLHNSGESLDETGIYIAGIPDADAFSANVKQALRNAKEGQYRILLSHRPNVANDMAAGLVDLQFSGHTHGGQLFPFTLAAKYGNGGFVSGLYKLPNTDLIVSRGAGYWGPPMRLMAPSDIIEVQLRPKI